MATASGDLCMTEWAECRTTIGRMDTALEDLRKYGFTLVTGLLTAGGLVGGVSSDNGAVVAVPAAAAIVMVLVLGLFALDMYYQVVLAGAVERAMDLEASTDPPVRLTTNVALAAHRSFSTYAIPFVYTLFLGTAASMAWLVKGAHNLDIVLLAVAIFAFMALDAYISIVKAGSLRTFKERHWVTEPPDPPVGPGSSTERPDLVLIEVQNIEVEDVVSGGVHHVVIRRPGEDALAAVRASDWAAFTARLAAHPGDLDR